MTPAEEEAIKEYISNGGNRHKAVMHAYPHIREWQRGAQDNFASLLFKKDHVAARVNNVQAKAAKQTEVTAEYILDSIVETMERCKQVAPVVDAKGEQIYVKNNDGDMVPAFEFNPSGVLSGANMLMKHKGLYEQDNRQKNQLNNAVGKLTVDQLGELADKLRAISSRE